MPNPNEFVVANCNYDIISIGPYAGNTLKECSRFYIVDNFVVDYRVQEENIHLYWKIDKLMNNKINEWKLNCLNKL